MSEQRHIDERIPSCVSQAVVECPICGEAFTPHALTEVSRRIIHVRLEGTADLVAHMDGHKA